jgi:MOSC domain-containing protein YiiM
MELVSVNVGLPREVPWKGRIVTTAIFKEPVPGRVSVRTLNLDGDRQADLSVHGGADKAVYVYPAEQYDYWRKELSVKDLPWGSFGENFSMTGLLEDAAHIGDRLRIGSAEFVITQPRLPCYKLGLKFGDPGMVKRFLDSMRTGFYVAVLKEGTVEAGNEIEWLGADESAVTVADITRLYLSEEKDKDKLQRAIRVSALPESWRSYFSEVLGKETSGNEK